MSNELISVNPATLAEVGRTPVTSTDELDAAVATAKAAQVDWAKDKQRRQGLMAACSVALMEHQKELAKLLCTEVGKPEDEAGWEVWVAAKAFANAARAEWDDEEEGPWAQGRTARLIRRPYGVVAAIVPWNFPVFLAAAKLAPALAAGNTVVMKPAESVPLTLARMQEILAKELPEGVLATVQGGPEVGSALINHRDVRKVSFTGSTGVGAKIMQEAAGTLTPVTLELGGNDPAVLLDDASIPLAAAMLASNAFYNNGQMCIAPKRAYVPADKVDEFCTVFAERMGTLTVGDGSQPGVKVGPLHTEAQLKHCQRLLDDAVKRGATVVKGGEKGTDLPGHFLEPTLVRDVDDSFDLVSVEQFGPVFPVVAYTDLDQVIDHLNSQEFGLGASVWSTDEERAVEVAERIDAGSVWVNQHNALEVELPFGGVKGSGFGREGGTAGIDDFTEWKVVSVKHYGA